MVVSAEVNSDHGGVFGEGGVERHPSTARAPCLYLPSHSSDIATPLLSDLV